MSVCRLKCDLLWAICRQHGWGDPVPSERVLRDGLDASERGQGRLLLPELVREPYVEYYPERGYRIKNDPDSHDFEEEAHGFSRGRNPTTTSTNHEL